MIVKRNFNILKVWGYVNTMMIPVMVWSVLCWAGYELAGMKFISISFVPVGVLGSALAIFVAFRNNSAYGRWWEARTLWGGIVNSSRVLARLIITFTDSHSHQTNYAQSRSEKFKEELVQCCIAWVHALRIHLRHQDEWELQKTYISSPDYEIIRKSQNKPMQLQLIMGKKIYEAMGNGTLGGFDSFQIEGQMLALANYQGACERIKNTPLPRQYDFFTRVFVQMFALMLPPGLLSLIASGVAAGASWLIIPLSIVIAGVFVIMERTGAANEDPFENKITDVPLTALCNTIERDLLEMLGFDQLPQKAEAENGYLY